VHSKLKAGTPAETTKSSRLEIVDGLRGYALFGLFLVHMTGYFELYNARPVPSLVQDTVLWLFLGKSFSLLAVCFGFSFFIMMDGARRRGQPFAARFAWRLAILFVIGLLHSLIYRGDIIAVLATAGFILIPFDRIRSNRTLLIVAIFLLLQPFLIIRILAGLAGYDWAWAEPLFYDDGGAMRPSLFGTFGELLQANIVAGKFSKWAFYIETGRIVEILGLYLVGLVLGRVRFFAEPERFLPERWTAEFRAALPRHAYFPFGGGPRTCIGESFAWMELVLIVATIARHWELDLVPGHPVVTQPLLTLRSKHGMRMTIRRRAAASA